MSVRSLLAGAVLAASSCLLSGAASAAPGGLHIVATIPSKDIVGGFAYGASSMWASDVQNTTLLRIDPETNTVTKRIRIGKPLRFVDNQDQVDGWLTVADGFVWATDQDHDRIVRVSPGSGRVVATVHVPSPWDIAVADGSVWVPEFEPYAVVRIDEKTNRIVKRWPAVGPTSVAAGAGSIWVVAHRANHVLRIDPTTNRIIAAITLEKATSPERIFFLFGSAWVSDGNETNNQLLRIDPATNRVSAVIHTPHAYFGNFALSDGRWLWALSPIGLVTKIDPQTNAVVAQASFATRGKCGTEQSPCFFNGFAYAAGTIWAYDVVRKAIIRIAG